MWSVEAHGHIPADPGDVWRYYGDPSTWPRWAHNTAAASVEGEVRTGARGRVRPLRGPEQPVTFVEVVPERALVSEVRPPGARMTFEYRLEPNPDGGVDVHHRLSMTGPLASLYGWLIRKRNARELVEEIGRLTRLVTSGG